MTTYGTTPPRTRIRRRLLPVAFAALASLAWQAAPAEAKLCLNVLADCCRSSRDSCNCVRTPGCLSLCSEISQCSSDLSLREQNFDPTAVVNATGKRIAIGGPLQCSADAPLRSLRVTVSQNGFVAEGRTKGRCTAEGGTWHAVVRSRGGGIFGVGPALACAVAQVGEKGDVPVTQQWCNDVTIVAE